MLLILTIASCCPLIKALSSCFFLLRSWQYLSFDPRPVVFVRIVGVENTANEVCSLLCNKLNQLEILSSGLSSFVFFTDLTNCGQVLSSKQIMLK